MTYGNKYLAGLTAAIYIVCAAAARPALADSSYQSSTQITGGTLKDRMTSNPLMAKMTGKMFAPVTSTTMVHGNQKAVVSPNTTEIWDLDAQTMTQIDTAKKTYWTVTFAEMRQAMSQVMEKMNQAPGQKPAPQQQSNLKVTYDLSVNNTGVTKPVNGVDAQEQVITMTATVTDPNSPQSPGQNPAVYVVTTDTWVALHDPPELKAIREFDVRLAKLMMQGVDASTMLAGAGQAKTQIGQMLISQPGAAAAFEQMGQKIASLKGTRVMTVTSLGGNAPAGNGAQAQASDTNAQQPSMLPGKLGSLGSVIGAFHKKQQAQQPAPAAAAPASGTVVLMQTTEQMLNFTGDSVPASSFQVPAGYKQVPSPYAQMSH
jgi:hypothetical protein